MECFKMAAKEVFEPAPGKPESVLPRGGDANPGKSPAFEKLSRRVEEGHSASVNHTSVAVFESVVSAQRLIDQTDQFLIFQYWAKLPAADKKAAMEEDSELGKRLRSAWESYLDFKKRRSR
jgi:hypothetical protein